MKYKFKQSIRRSSWQAGQALIMTVILMGGIMIGTTAIAGIVLIYAVRSATLAGFSSQAIYAADAGLEWELYQYFAPGGTNQPPPNFNDVNVVVETCSFVVEDLGVTNNADSSGDNVRRLDNNGNCDGLNPDLTMRSVGKAGPESRKVNRAFELIFTDN